MTTTELVFTPANALTVAVDFLVEVVTDALVVVVIASTGSDSSTIGSSPVKSEGAASSDGDSVVSSDGDSVVSPFKSEDGVSLSVLDSDMSEGASSESLAESAKFGNKRDIKSWLEFILSIAEEEDFFEEEICLL